MNYGKRTAEILMELGIYKRYKGCEYIVECVQYVQKCDNQCIPMTKEMYAEVAEKCHTSSRCIERDIRNVIRGLWKKEENIANITKMFGAHNLRKRPSNMEFVMLLHNYIKYERKWKDIIHARVKEHTFICPMTGHECKFCGEIVDNLINELCE